MNFHIRTLVPAIIVSACLWSSATVAVAQEPLNVEVFMSSEEHMGRMGKTNTS